MDLTVALLIAVGCFSVGVILGYWYGHDSGGTAGRTRGWGEGFEDGLHYRQICKPD